MDCTGWLTMTQVAERLRNKSGRQASRAWAHKLRAKGEFPSALQIGGVFVVDPLDVTEYLNRLAIRRKEQHHA